MPKRAIGLLKMLAFGAVVGSLLDGLHTHSGTTSYPDPVFWMMAWWTPLLFGCACVGVGLAYAQAHGDRAPADAMRFAWVSVLMFSALYALSGYLPASNSVKLIVLLIGGIALWALSDRSRPTLVVGLLAAIVGPLTEIALVHFQTFRHLQPDIAGIPMWLPALYFAAAPGAGPFIASLGRESCAP